MAGVAGLADQYTLSQDPTFRQRVQLALVAAAIAIMNENVGTPLHPQRFDLAKNILANPAAYAVLISEGIATDLSVATDAGSPATQASVTDAHINAAVSSQWNSYAQ